jgi:hypothetical protein
VLLAGVPTVTPPPGALLSSRLPAQISSGRALAALGTRLFYVLNGGSIGSTVIGTPRSDKVVVTLPHCQSVSQIAAAGHTLAYVVVEPVGATGGSAGCRGDSLVAWSLWLLDLQSGTRRQVASGGAMPSFVDQYDFPVHIALSDATFAFDLPTGSFDFAGHNLNDPDAIEVHSLDGTLRWISPVGQRIVSVMLGGNRLAVLTAAGSGGGTQDTLWVADPTQTEPRQVSEPAASAALSPDGRYLAWDLPSGNLGGGPIVAGVPGVQSAIGIKGLGSDDPLPSSVPSGEQSGQPLDPVVTSTPRGPLVAWLAGSSNGNGYVVFRRSWEIGGSAVPSTGRPAWLSIQGGSLVWVANSGGNPSQAFALDLSRLP